MRYCSACGSSLSIARPEGEDRDRHCCDGCGTVHYINPKVVVGAVCTDENDQLLLCRRAIPPRTGFWTIPAGYLELGESAEEGAVREAFEEARARIEISGLIAVYSLKRAEQVQILFRAKLLDPNVEAGPESLEVGLFAWRRIPWDELAFPTVRWVLERALSLRGHAGPLVTVGNP